MNDSYKYLAFISYKREDEKWAKWLQHKLEHYKLPTSVRKLNPVLPERVRPIFRDTTDLAGGVLETAIKDALDTSRYLIVICSPRAAQSVWVCKEVQEFIDTGREDFIIPFIVDGEPNSIDVTQECFPQNLRDLSGERELLGVNINEMGRDAAAIKVVARIFGLQFDVLWRRWEREKRLRNLVIIISVLTLLFISLGGILYLQKQNTIIRESETLIQVQNDSLKSQKADLIRTLNELEISERNLKETNIALSQINKSLEHEKNKVLNKNRAMLENRNRYLSRLCIDLSNEGNLLLAELIMADITPHEQDAPERPFVPEMEYALRHLHRMKDLNDGFYILSTFKSPSADSYVQKIVIDSTFFYAPTDRGIYRYNFCGERISTIFELPQIDTIETSILDYDLNNHLVLYEYETLNSESPCLVLFNYKTKSTIQTAASSDQSLYDINDNQEIRGYSPESYYGYDEYRNYYSYIKQETIAVLGDKLSTYSNDTLELRYPIIDLCLSKNSLGIIYDKTIQDEIHDTLLFSLFSYTDDLQLTPILENHSLPFLNDENDIRSSEIRLLGEISNYSNSNSQSKYWYYLFRNDNDLFFYNFDIYFKFNINTDITTKLAANENALLIGDQSNYFIIKRNEKYNGRSIVVYTDDYYVDRTLFDGDIRYSIYDTPSDSEVAVLPHNFRRPSFSNFNRGSVIIFEHVDSTYVCNLDRLSMRTYETRFSSFIEASNDGKYLFLKQMSSWTEGQFCVIDNATGNNVFKTYDVEYVLHMKGLVHNEAYSDIIGYSLFDIYLLDKHNYSIKGRVPIQTIKHNDTIKSIRYYTSEEIFVETDSAFYVFNLEDASFEFLFNKPNDKDEKTSISLHPSSKYLIYSNLPIGLGSRNSKTWIWNLESNSLVEYFESPIYNPRFSKDGKHIIVSKWNSRDYLLDFPSIEDLCNSINSNSYGCSLSEETKQKYYLGQ